MIALTLLLLACFAFGVAGIFQCRRLLVFKAVAVLFVVGFVAFPVLAQSVDCSTVAAGSTADCPLYVNLLGPLGPASAAGAPGIVDGPTARYAFEWAFGAVAVMFLLGLSVGAGVNVIRKG